LLLLLFVIHLEGRNIEEPKPETENKNTTSFPNSASIANKNDTSIINSTFTAPPNGNPVSPASNQPTSILNATTSSAPNTDISNSSKLIQVQNLTTSDFINATKGFGGNTFAGGAENATIANPPQAVSTEANLPQNVSTVVNPPQPVAAKITNQKLTSSEREKSKEVKKPVKGSARSFLKFKKTSKVAKATKATTRSFMKSKRRSGVLRRSKLNQLHPDLHRYF